MAYFSENYRKYIKSRAWQKKRQAAIQYWGGRCMACGTSKGIQVHHLTYERLGNELMDDLRILCYTHHKEVTRLHKALGRRRITGLEAFNIYLSHKKKR